MTPFSELKSRLYTAVLSDVLDSMGYMHQAMRPFVRPLDDALVLMGRARTGLWMSVFSVTEGENPCEHEIALIDDLKPDDAIALALANRRVRYRHRCHRAVPQSPYDDRQRFERH
jgi:4-hydroxy-4-methyl-2-oxoglutarate aldolase